MQLKQSKIYIEMKRINKSSRKYSRHIYIVELLLLVVSLTYEQKDKINEFKTK